LSPLLTPAPVPLIDGEALFSLLGRWLHRTGAREATEFVKAVTRGPARTISLSFPSGFEWLRQAHPGLAGIGPEELVCRYTAAPLYRPFLSQHAWTQLVTHLARDGSRQARMLLGIPRSGGGIVRPMHCPACMLEQLKSCGHIFWPLQFTIPYVDACPRHGLRLQAIRPASCIYLGKSRFLGFPSEAAARDAPHIPAAEVQVRIAALATELAASRLRSVPASDLAETYLVALNAKGFMEAGGRVRRLALWGALQERWGALPEMRVGAGRHFPAWFTGLYAAAGPTVRCPMYHLLLIGLLFDGVPTWRAMLSHVQQQRPPSREELRRDKVAQEPAMGTRFVQLRHWLEQDRPCSKETSVPEAVVAHLSSGQRVSEVAAATGVSRHRIYRLLRGSPQLAREWALRAFALENARRRGAAPAVNSAADVGRQTTAPKDKKWVYRHRSTLARLKVA
jgi:hypothetical protein